MALLNRHIGNLLVGGAAAALVLSILGCTAGGTPATGGPTVGATGSSSPVAIGPVPASAAPSPSGSGGEVVGGAPCISATTPGQPCGRASTGPAGSRIPAPVPTPIPVAPVPPVTARSTPTAAPPATPVPTRLAASPGTLVVTAADNVSTLHLAVGERFVLELGSSTTWSVTVADPRVVGPAPGVTAPAGAQGVYEALAAGTTTLSAVGSPVCPSGACPLFRIAFDLTIIVG